MATIQEVSPAPWRMAMLPASFAGVQYHVEQQGRSGGRRVVMHEYPKRDSPYAEDMGRSATRYQVTGYLVGPSYNQTKLALITALEKEGGGQLVDPYLVRPMQAICDRYSVTETREKGGYCTFEMSFSEIGSPGFSNPSTNTSTAVQSSASDAADAIADEGNAGGGETGFTRAPGTGSQ